MTSFDSLCCFLYVILYLPPVITVLILFFSMSELLCSHFRSPVDPHPVCCRCLERAGLVECSPENTCEFCADLEPHVWARIIRTRQKRLQRKIARVRKLDISAAVAATMAEAQVTETQTVGSDADQASAPTQAYPAAQRLTVAEVFSSSDEDDAQESDSSRASASDSVPPSGRTSAVNAECMETDDPFAPAKSRSPRRNFILDEPGRDVFSSPVPTGSEEWLRAVTAIDVPELIKWTAQHSEFSFAQTREDSRARVQLRSQAPSFDTPEPFIGLSSDTVLVSSFEKFTLNYIESDVDQIQSSIGKYISPKSDFRVNMATYKLSDSAIRTEAMRFPLAMPNFVYAVKGNTAAPVRDVDLQHLEEIFRKTLVICSNLEASMQALVSEYPKGVEPDVFMMRSLYRVSQGLSDIAQLSSKGFHQTVTHRRDASLNPVIHHPEKPLRVADDHLLRLRHAPSLDAKYVFDKAILSEIQTERQASSQDKLLSVAMSKIASTKPPKSRDNSQRRKARSASAGAKPAAQASAAQSTPVTTAPSQPKQYR